MAALGEDLGRDVELHFDFEIFSEALGSKFSPNARFVYFKRWLMSVRHDRVLGFDTGHPRVVVPLPELKSGGLVFGAWTCLCPVELRVALCRPLGRELSGDVDELLGADGCVRHSRALLCCFACASDVLCRFGDSGRLWLFVDAELFRRAVRPPLNSRTAASCFSLWTRVLGPARVYGRLSGDLRGVVECFGVDYMGKSPELEA